MVDLMNCKSCTCTVGVACGDYKTVCQGDGGGEGTDDEGEGRGCTVLQLRRRQECLEGSLLSGHLSPSSWVSVPSYL